MSRRGFHRRSQRRYRVAPQNIPPAPALTLGRDPFAPLYSSPLMDQVLRLRADEAWGNLWRDICQARYGAPSVAASVVDLHAPQPMRVISIRERWWQRAEAGRQLLARLCEAQNYRCAYCGVVMTNDPSDIARATREHVRPRSRGGRDGWDNEIGACALCNEYRSSSDAEEIFRLIQKWLRRGSWPHGVALR